MQIQKYSQFINFPIYLWSEKTVKEEVPVEEDETDEKKEEATKDDEAEKDETEKDGDEADVWLLFIFYIISRKF